MARTLLAAWLDARAHGGRISLRIEDIDLPRTVPGAAESFQEDLTWLGLDWDEGPTLQSSRFDRYVHAIEVLERQGRIFACTCSRKEIALASSAPHGPADEGPRYPGTCRDGVTRSDRPRALRLRTERDDYIRHVDRVFGACDQDVHAVAGDFVLKRGDGLWAYQLAVTVDDLEQGVTAIVRGSDLLSSTPRQILLRRLLGETKPIETLHVPLLLGPTGERLAKRDGPIAVADRRAAGVSSEAVLGMLAASLGQIEKSEPISARELVTLWDVTRIPTQSQKLEAIES